MKEKELLVPRKRLLIILIVNLGFLVYGIVAKIFHLDFSGFFLGMATAIFMIAWFLVLADMIRNKIYNKVFWILSMFIIPHISSLFYLIQREKLIRLGHKF